MQLLTLACDGVPDTFDLDSQISSSSGCLFGTQDSVANLVDRVGIRSIIHESDFATASPVFAWQMMRAVD